MSRRVFSAFTGAFAGALLGGGAASVVLSGRLAPAEQRPAVLESAQNALDTSAAVSDGRHAAEVEVEVEEKKEAAVATVEETRVKVRPKKGLELSPHNDLHFQLLEGNLLPLGSANVRWMEAYVASADLERKIPKWVIIKLTRDDWTRAEDGNSANRKHSRFNSDISLPFVASNRDYYKSGYSRGHLVAAGDTKRRTQEAMNETFLLPINIVPQIFSNNAGWWYRLEVWVRKVLTAEFDEVYVVSGPLFLPTFDEETGKSYVKYEVIGPGQVAAPTHLYKVVLAERDGQRYTAAFVVPNKEWDSPVTNTIVPVSALEESTGLLFFEGAKGSTLPLCDTFDCDGGFMSKQQLEDWNVYRRLGWAKSEGEMQRVWQEYLDNGGKPDKATKQRYQAKLAEWRKKEEQEEQEEKGQKE